MFREMRRIRQLMSSERASEVLSRCSNGVLACMGDDDYPYAVPLNYVWHDGHIYFHSAKAGHKIDAIIKTPKVSFAVIDEDKIVSEEYTSYFRSVVIFGRARIVEHDGGDGEWTAAFRALVEKYSGDQPEDEKATEIAKCERSHIIAIDVDHVTGKEAKELLKTEAARHN
ncbi:MAG: uncharacterized protein PWP10_3910 [Clostridiales bacterium]|nr:uncharacterized protein [Clostridiales bacterium]